jgi:hypothetical protein
MAEVQRLFDKANAVLDYDRFESKASVAQVKLLWTLERSLYGTPRTPAGLSWMEADSSIKALRATIESRRTGIKALEYLVNDRAPLAEVAQ